MATVAAPPPALAHPEPVVLRDVAWETYCQLRDLEANDHVRMTYLDGRLTLMSPALRHERNNRLLAKFVEAVAAAVGLAVLDIGSTTLRRAAPADERAGAGKEPDTAFYLGANEELMRTKDDLELGDDPPPDLAIEVDNTRDSTESLAVYARLGVPEVWRYRVEGRSVIIHRLVDGAYREAERSVALPVLTPALIREAIDRYAAGDLDQNAWTRWVEAWARGLAGPEGAG